MNKVLEHMLREVEALPEEKQQRIARVLEDEVRKAKQEAPAPAGRWARLAERLSKESPLEGKSEEFLQHVKEFREGFMFREPKVTD
jgi:hypothetical protein